MGGQKGLKIQFEGFKEPVFKAFILFVSIMELVSHEKALPPNPNSLPLIRKGSVEDVM